MNGARNFDRWALCFTCLLLGAVTVYGMRIGNLVIAEFGKYNFGLAFGALMILMNRELIGASNGNGNSNGLHSEEKKL